MQYGIIPLIFEIAFKCDLIARVIIYKTKTFDNEIHSDFITKQIKILHFTTCEDMT